MKRTFSIKVDNNHYILQELATDGSELSDDEYYDWVDKYNVTFLEDEELNDLICQVVNGKVERLCDKSEANEIYNEVLPDNAEWFAQDGDENIYYVKPELRLLF